jgi:uncharacterized membrane protein
MTTQESAMSGAREPRHLEILTIVGLGVIALASRFYGLDVSYVIDEYYTALYASDRIVGQSNPSYYALVVISHYVFGASEWSTRLPAAILGAVAIPSMYWIGRQLFSRNIGTYAALITLFCSWHLIQSQMGRFYSGVFLFSAFAIYHYVVALRDDKFRSLVFACALIALSASFHSTAVFLGAAFWLYSLAVYVNSAVAKDQSRRIAGYLLIMGIAGCLVVLPYGWGLLQRWSGGGHTSDTFQNIELLLQLVKYVGIPLSAFSLFGLIALISRSHRFALLGLVVIVVPLLAMMLGSSFMAIRPRYGIFALPVICLAAAYLCDQLNIGLSKTYWLRHAPLAVLIICMLPTFISHYTSRSTSDIRHAIAFVDNNLSVDDEIIALTRGVEFYASDTFTIAWREDGYNSTIDWAKKLARFECRPIQYWLIVRTGRGPLAEGLRLWLSLHARLVWSESALRFDRDVEGFEVLLVDGYSRSCNEQRIDIANREPR